jgi:spermidine synthase
MLGNAAGTVSRAYGRYYPGTEIDGVEIDGEVTDVGDEFFELSKSNPKLRTYDEDARPFLRRIDREYDVIGIDAYRQPYIPFYLATKEFFQLTRDRLSEDGAVVVNVGHPEGQDALEETLTKTLLEVFPHVKRYAIADTSTLLVASRVEPRAERLASLPARNAKELALVASDAASRLQAPLDGGRVMTDDKAPVEWLIDSSIVSYAAEGADGD